MEPSGVAGISQKLLCEVSNCQKSALYKCPRCSVRYCSTDCYGTHSESCVREFRDEELQALRGKTVSDIERRRFSNVLKRLNDENGGTLFEDYRDHPVVSPENCHTINSGSTNDQQHNVRDDLLGVLNENKESDESEDDGNEDDEDNDEDAAGLLTDLMQQLDGKGKDALFSVLHKSMILRDEDNVVDKNVDKKEGNKFNGNYREISKRRRRKNRSTNMEFQSQKKEDDIGDELEVLLEDMQLNEMSYEEILQRLPDSLRADFETRLRDGRLEELVQPWTPWWSSKSTAHTQQRKRTCSKTDQEVTKNNDIDSDSDDGEADENLENSSSSQLPSLPTTNDLVISVSDARKIASPNIIYSLVDTIASYCLTMRHANGEWSSDTISAARDLWRTSAVLADNARHSSVEDVCKSVMNRTDNKQIGLSAIRDGVDILGGGSSSVARALFDAARLGLAAAEDVKTKGGKKIVLDGVRKLMFFTAWVLAESSEGFRVVARMALTFTDVMSGDADEVRIARNVVRGGDSVVDRNDLMWLV